MGYKQKNPSGRKGGQSTRARTKKPYKVICAKCGKNTTVPFKPIGTGPVYCRTCFDE